MMSVLSISRRLRRLAPVILLLAAAAAACSPSRRGARGGTSDPPAVLIFSNEALEQATVYVVAPGLDFTRIGTVFAGRTERLTVPAQFARGGTVNIVAR